MRVLQVSVVLALLAVLASAVVSPPHSHDSDALLMVDDDSDALLQDDPPTGQDFEQHIEEETGLAQTTGDVDQSTTTPPPPDTFEAPTQSGQKGTTTETVDTAAEPWVPSREASGPFVSQRFADINDCKAKAFGNKLIISEEGLEYMKQDGKTITPKTACPGFKAMVETTICDLLTTEGPTRDPQGVASAVFRAANNGPKTITIHCTDMVPSVDSQGTMTSNVGQAFAVGDVAENPKCEGVVTNKQWSECLGALIAAKTLKYPLGSHDAVIAMHKEFDKSHAMNLVSATGQFLSFDAKKDNRINSCSAKPTALPNLGYILVHELFHAIRITRNEFMPLGCGEVDGVLTPADFQAFANIVDGAIALNECKGFKTKFADATPKWNAIKEGDVAKHNQAVQDIMRYYPDLEEYRTTFGAGVVIESEGKKLIMNANFWHLAVGVGVRCKYQTDINGACPW